MLDTAEHLDQQQADAGRHIRKQLIACAEIADCPHSMLCLDACGVTPASLDDADDTAASGGRA